MAYLTDVILSIIASSRQTDVRMRMGVIGFGASLFLPVPALKEHGRSDAKQWFDARP